MGKFATYVPTKDERDFIARLIDTGLTGDQIAAALNISSRQFWELLKMHGLSYGVRKPKAVHYCTECGVQTEWRKAKERKLPKRTTGDRK